jgi:uncharacterized SAM-binding protein YcdF (DUF218 family)
VLLALLGIFLSSWQPAEWLLSRPLEIWYSNTAPPEQDKNAQAIVVLSSSVQPTSKYWPVPLPDWGTYARCRYAAHLYGQGLALPVFVSGGSTPRSRRPFADEMTELLIKEGVRPQDIQREDRSRNTYENAKYTADLLKKIGIQRIVLIVDAASMLRAEWCFRRQGIDVVPAPFGHREFEVRLSNLLPSWGALRGNELTLHEVGGLVWYKLRGWI